MSTKTTLTDKEQEFDTVFTEAMKFRDNGDLERAKTLCLEIVRNLTQDDRKLMAIVHGQLGYIHKLLDDLMTAEHHCRLSVHHAPKAELASLSLFHVLVDQGRWREAIEEAIRYLSLKDSAEYRSIFEHDDYPSEFDAPTTSLLIEVRRLLKIHLGRN